MLQVTSANPSSATPSTPVDNLAQASNYLAQINTHTVMGYVVQTYPEIKARHYTPEDLILDVTPSPSTTAAIITLLATTTHASDSVMIANDVANGFQSYIQSVHQKSLNTKRTSLTSQIDALNKDKAHWDSLLQQLPSNTLPQFTIYSNNSTRDGSLITTLQTQLNTLPTTADSGIAVINSAAPKDVTSTPKGLIIAAVIAGIGLVLGILIMLLVIFLDNRLRSDDQVNEKLGMAYLGSLSNSNDLKENPTHVTGPTLQEVSDISANLRLTGILPSQWQAPQGPVLLVTSPQVAEGKSTFTAALASSIARSGGTVAVVDADLQKPSTHLAFGMSPAGIGLGGLIKSGGRENIDDAILRTNVPGVWLLPAGVAMDDAILLLGQRLPDILAQLRRKADLVIIDGPALLNSAGSSQLANMVDGVALVIDSRHDKLSLLMRTRDLLTSLTHTPAGIIMNRFSGRGKNRYYATAYRRRNTSDLGKRLTNQTYAVNANENGNGSRPDSISVVRSSTPNPSGIASPIPPNANRPVSMPGVSAPELQNGAPMMQPFQLAPRPAPRDSNSQK
ncbi:MAG: hypothetical protein M3Z24_05605 [Chloroflexota bacterium]|nr:hypothetical protein [Chloroflexota bacterium]